ncbi:MAG: hypothetical protein MPK06_00300 [Alphaproteobacteria bacterium]|nr:hypothetical protein [Alphaproteobacteria bacterium]MDA8004088.1 hypothetical protein [Alphaproteobacteria bacterium]MDA8004983.1 hypothetical protein [Alphaproteobacteria bacterium]MDA8012969.1 hypothetical protein [Alphaproteobacteria bacterium]
MGKPITLDQRFLSEHELREKLGLSVEVNFDVAALVLKQGDATTIIPCELVAAIMRLLKLKYSELVTTGTEMPSAVPRDVLDRRSAEGLRATLSAFLSNPEAAYFQIGLSDFSISFMVTDKEGKDVRPKQ